MEGVQMGEERIVIALTTNSTQIVQPRALVRILGGRQAAHELQEWQN